MLFGRSESPDHVVQAELNAPPFIDKVTCLLRNRCSIDGIMNSNLCVRTVLYQGVLNLPLRKASRPGNLESETLNNTYRGTHGRSFLQKETPSGWK